MRYRVPDGAFEGAALFRVDGEVEAAARTGAVFRDLGEEGGERRVVLDAAWAGFIRVQPEAHDAAVFVDRGGEAGEKRVVEGDQR
ncbi:MAG: hypothetical protein WDM81_03175 [Rhizomicrobium sp.]